MSHLIPITDTHQHLIDPALGVYSWAGGIPQLAGRSFDLDAYQKAIGGTGVTRTIFMETTPDDWRAETPHIHQLAARPGSIIQGVISNCHPEDDDFALQLDAFAGPKLAGLRRICHVDPDDLSRSPKFRENLRLAAHRGLTFDLCFLERQLPVALELVRACPETSFILDHCGVPDIAGGRMDPWRAHIRDLASEPNVACKISGVLAYTKPDEASAGTVRPWIEHCIESFGWDRVVWGSDWPLVTMHSTLRDWVSITRDLVKHEPEENQRKLFHQNAERIYGI